MRSRILLFLLIISTPSFSQEMWGISNSNFAGNMGIFLNPSSFIGAPYQYEINLVAGDLFAENNYVYFPREHKVIPDGIVRNEQRPGLNYFKDRSGQQNGFAHGLLIGPSYLHNKTTWGWGIHCAFRTEISLLNMSPQFALLLYDNFRPTGIDTSTHSADNFTSAYASWIEIGVTYGKLLRDEEHHIVKWAGTANALLGINGYYIDNKAMDFTSVDSTAILVHNMNTTFAHSINNENESYFGLRGLGLSTTLGATYINHPNRGAFDCNMANDRLRKYKYRLGISIIDLGLIHYFDDTQIINISTQTDRTWNGVDTLHFSSIQSLDTAMINSVGGNIENKAFNIWLPLGASIQFDYQVRPNLFANLSIVNRIHFAANEIARGNQANLSVRYERRRFEGAVNVTMFEYKDPSLGVGLRYRFFVIGSDRLLSLFGLPDQRNFDFFFGLKFQFCKRPFSPGPDCPAYQ